MSAWAMVWGILPLTSLAVGALAEKWPVNLVIGVCGGICLLSAAGIPVLSNQLNEL